MSKSGMLLWLDLETNGLNSDIHSILEVGVILTDINLVEFDRGSWIIHHNYKLVKATADPIVQTMHTDNGLWDLVFDPLMSLPYDTVETDFEITVNSWREKYGLLHPAGSSVHFDVEFLRAHDWDLSALHHRHFDVSSIKMFSESVMGTYDDGHQDPHRAIPDLENDLRWIRDLRNATRLTLGL